MILHHSAINSKASLITSHFNFKFLLHILNINLFSDFHIQARNLQFGYLHIFVNLRMQI